MVLDKNYLDKVNISFEKRVIDGVLYYSAPSFSEYNSAFFTRHGGVSEGIFSSLNFSRSRESDELKIQRNFEIAANAIGVKPEQMVLCNYEHGTNIEIVDVSHAGMGIVRQNILPKCDGLITNDSNVVICSLHADCMPIYYADKYKRAWGVCHAGWRGIYNGIVTTVVEKFKEFNVNPDDILFAVGPSILKCCFEVGPEVTRLFSERYGEQTVCEKNGKTTVDLYTALLIQLAGLEIPPENITLSNICTFCEPEHFYSYRREQGKTGAHLSTIYRPY